MNNIQEKIDQAIKYKDEGNNHFKSQNYVKALSCYHKVFLYVNGLISEKDDLAQYSQNNLLTNEQQDQINQLKCITYCNMAQVYIYQKKFEKGKDVAQKSYQINKTIKALYRLAICNIELNYLDEAKQQLQQIKEEDPKFDIKEETKKIQLKEKAGDKIMAQAMKKLFI